MLKVQHFLLKTRHVQQTLITSGWFSLIVCKAPAGIDSGKMIIKQSEEDYANCGQHRCSPLITINRKTFNAQFYFLRNPTSANKQKNTAACWQSETLIIC